MAFTFQLVEGPTGPRCLGFRDGRCLFQPSFSVRSHGLYGASPQQADLPSGPLSDIPTFPSDRPFRACRIRTTSILANRSHQHVFPTRQRHCRTRGTWKTDGIHRMACICRLLHMYGRNGTCPRSPLQQAWDHRRNERVQLLPRVSVERNAAAKRVAVFMGQCPTSARDATEHIRCSLGACKERCQQLDTILTRVPPGGFFRSICKHWWSRRTVIQFRCGQPESGRRNSGLYDRYLSRT